MTEKQELGVWVDADLAKEVRSFAWDHRVTTSELGRLALIGMMAATNA